ncbi:MAG: hypothetical protein HYZ13_14115 [Acidobacteria bacterium]|nr:hypothetical protein [Acidobacteriota bacterium]
MREFSTEHARQCLDAIGLDVRDIKVVQNEKRADLLATFQQETYIVEAKNRSAHTGWLELVQMARSKGAGTHSRDVQPWNALSSMIQVAYAQLIATPAPSNAFRILWVVAPHGDADFVLECLKIRFFGLARLVVIQDSETPPVARDCFHYGRSEFERTPHLDAVILGNIEAGQLLLNCLSKNKDQFKKSYLYKWLHRANAVVDPEEKEADGKAFLIPIDIEGGRNPQANWQYLKQTYGVKTSVMRKNAFYGPMSIEMEEPGTDSTPLI